jgi:hypothetical protein
MLQWRLRKLDALTVAGAVPGLHRERYAMRTGFPFQPYRHYSSPSTEDSDD